MKKGLSIFLTIIGFALIFHTDISLAEFENPLILIVIVGIVFIIYTLLKIIDNKIIIKKRPSKYVQNQLVLSQSKFEYSRKLFEKKYKRRYLWFTYPGVVYLAFVFFSIITNTNNGILENGFSILISSLMIFSSMSAPIIYYSLRWGRKENSLSIKDGWLVYKSIIDGGGGIDGGVSIIRFYTVRRIDRIEIKNNTMIIRGVISRKKAENSSNTFNDINILKIPMIYEGMENIEKFINA